MTIYNFGSINLDHVYQVDHFVRPSETMSSLSYQCLLGGKGANQSVALAKAGANVKHVGAVNKGDGQVLAQLEDLGVNTDLIAKVDTAIGHAIIQLSKEGENSILLYPGANHELTESQVDEVLKNAQKGDWVLLQNETNLVAYIAQQAHNQNVKVAFNPAPMDAELTLKILENVDLLIVNEVEAMDLAKVSSIEEAAKALPEMFPELAVLMTLGKDGARYFNGEDDITVPAFVVEVKDTTAAGDTFIGFVLSALSKEQTGQEKQTDQEKIEQEQTVQEAMRMGCAASALCVAKIGASVSIPTLSQVEDFLSQHA